MRWKLAALLLCGFAAIRPAIAATVFTSSGATAADITATVNDFRSALGTLNPNQPVNFAGGRREINWDAVPAASRNPFPGTFFNGSVPGRARGIEFSGSPFETPVPGANDPFAAFSAPLIFDTIGSLSFDIDFFSPKDQTTDATTRGFGAIFLDVDEDNTTSMEFFSLDGLSLGKYFAPKAQGDRTFSFVGVTFPSAQVAKVRIVAGSDTDAVAMDDFLYGEPQAVPEPSTWMTLAAGAGLVAWKRRPRRQA